MFNIGHESRKIKLIFGLLNCDSSAFNKVTVASDSLSFDLSGMHLVIDSIQIKICNYLSLLYF